MLGLDLSIRLLIDKKFLMVFGWFGVGCKWNLVLLDIVMLLLVNVL